MGDEGVDGGGYRHYVCAGIVEVQLGHWLAIAGVNGKLRGRVVVPAGSERGDIESAARHDERIAALLEGQAVRKVVVVPGKLINFVLASPGA